MIANRSTAAFLIGIDVGTTWCKAAVIALDGREVAHGRRATPWIQDAAGTEIDPTALADAAIGSAIDALGAAPEGSTIAIGVCSMGETGVMVGDRDEPLAPGIAWHDARGGPESRSMATELGSRTFTRRTGLPVGPFWTAPKFDALRAAHPQITAGLWWLSVAEWVVARLGGEHVAERSLASRTGFLDVSEGAWWTESLERVGLVPEQMPPLIVAGTPAGAVSDVDRLRGAILTVAGHDHPCASVGASAIRTGDAFDSCGTAEAIVRSVPCDLAAGTIDDAVALGLTIGCHVVPDRQAMLGYFRAGLWLTRILEGLGVNPSGLDRAALDTDALGVTIDGATVDISEDAPMIPAGEHVTPAGVWAAAQTAAARETDRILERMGAVTTPHDRIVMAGGWSRSEPYRELKRRVIGPFETPAIAEAGARGAALFGGLAAGVYDSVETFPVPAMIRV